MKTISGRSGRENYYNTLTRVGEAVDITLKKFWEEDRFGKAKLFMYEPFLKRKWGKQKLRATLTYLCYCAFTGQNPDSPIDSNLMKLMASTELGIWAEYTTNWIVDNKGEVKNNPLNRRKAVISAKSFLEDAVRMAGQVGQTYSDRVLDMSGNTTWSFMEELVADMSNTKLLTGPLEEYMKAYRIDYSIPGIGKTFSHGADLAALYSGRDKTPEAKKLHDILVAYGIDLATLNGLGDFCRTKVSTDKAQSDQFADTRNGVMTPPIWLMYNGANEEEREFILSCAGKDSLINEEESRLIKLIFETGCYDMISEGLKKGGRTIKGLIRGLKFKNEGGARLQIASTILESSTIYHVLKENYAEITGTDWNPEKELNKPLKIRYADYLRGEYEGLRRRIINHDDFLTSRT